MREFSRNLLALAIGTLLGILAMELGLVLVWGAILGNHRLLVSDSELGWRALPNAHYSQRRGDAQVWSYETGSRGYRKLPEGGTEASPLTLFLGDSFVFGEGVNADEHFLAQLARTGRYRIRNGGVVGYSTDQSVLQFETGEWTPSRLVLMSYLANDLADNPSHFHLDGLRFKPRFRLDDDVLHLEPNPHPLLNWLRHESFLVRVLLGVVYTARPQLGLFDRPPADADRERALYRALVARLVEAAAQRDVDRVIVVYWSFRSHDPEGFADLRLPELPGTEVELLNLDAAFRREGLDAETLYFPANVDPGHHWNAEGHRRVAQILDAALTPSGRPVGAAPDR
jgi:hypothetical protein